MAVDLHTHSDRSDGTDPPERVVALAARAGLTALALTDHDNLDGIEAARMAADQHGIELVPGTELSVTWPKGAMHMLVYFLEPGPGPLQDRLAELQASRHHRNVGMVDALQQLGFDITWAEVEKEARGTGIGRPHIAAVLVRNGAVPDIPAAFDRLLARGRPAYRDRRRLDYQEAAALARASGAVPVVAHPHTIAASAEDYEAALRTVAAAGVAGVETYYSEYAPELRRHLAALAASLGLIATGGSDYHGSYKPDISVGIGRGDLVVPDQALQAVRTLAQTG